VATIQDVAQKTGVSVATISRVLNNKSHILHNDFYIYDI